MAYRISRADARISIELDGKEAFVLEREDDGRGFWSLFPVRDGVRGAKIDRDQYSNDLIERVTGGLLLAGHMAHVPAGYVIPVPVNTGGFYVSGLGYLCCRVPVQMVLTESPLAFYGIKGPHQIRPATLEERQEAGLDVRDATNTAVLLAP